MNSTAMEVRESWSTAVVGMRPSAADDPSDPTNSVRMASVAGAVVFVILLVCTTTVGSLLVGAAITRQQEIGVRLALGASPARIVRQLLTESVLLSTVAGSLGLLLYWAIVRGLAAEVPGTTIGPDWQTVAFTLLLAAGTALLCGLAPALHAAKHGLATVLKDVSTGVTARARLQRVFVVAQVALTQPLLLSLAMVVGTLAGTLTPRPGASIADQVVEVSLETDARSTAARQDEVLGRVTRRLAALPGVVGVVRGVPADLDDTARRVTRVIDAPNGGGATAQTVHLRAIPRANGYFRLLDVPLTRGREFDAEDLTYLETPIIVGSDLAAALFGMRNPIGVHLRPPRNATGGPLPSALKNDWVVVGVVDSHQTGPTAAGHNWVVFVPDHLGSSTDPLDLPWMADLLSVPRLLVRTRGPAAPGIAAMRSAVRAEAPGLAPNITILADDRRRARSDLVTEATVMAGAGMLTLLLAAVGLYAVVGLAVGQRTREIGLRVALGARPIEIVRLFFLGGVRLSAMGLIIGLPLSGVAIWLVTSSIGLYPAHMPLLAVIVAVIVLGVATLATWLPARRAAWLDPIVALRIE